RMRSLLQRTTWGVRSMPIKQFLGALATAGLLAGCSSDIDTLRNTSGTGSAFTKALTDEYRLLSAADADNYDWPNAGYFARKRLSGAGGRVVLPGEPAPWHLPPEKIKEISKSRADLMRRLDDGFREDAPETTARAQARFDCWVEEQEENPRPAEIAACR